jgi:hypothetical protein
MRTVAFHFSDKLPHVVHRRHRFGYLVSYCFTDHIWEKYGMTTASRIGSVASFFSAVSNALCHAHMPIADSRHF